MKSTDRDLFIIVWSQVFESCDRLLTRKVNSIGKEVVDFHGGSNLGQLEGLKLPDSLL